jgi:hypothetical protein
MTREARARYVDRVSWSTRARALLARACLPALIAIALVPACSIGQGQGSVTGELDVPDCWSGRFDLHPDFFAAVPATGSNGVPAQTNSMQLRIQSGDDFQTFSDGVIITIDDATLIRGGGSAGAGLLDVPLVVGLPPSALPPGVPITPVANPPIVHAALYLNRTCRTQNDALYALAAVTTNPDGSCSRPDGGEPPLPCGAPATAASTDGGADASVAPDAGGGGDAGASSPAPGLVKQSTIVFQRLFDGDPGESNAADRYTNVPQCPDGVSPGGAMPCGFDFYLANPREICPGGLGPPPRCRGHIQGWFNFYFQRGKPAQPFP